MTFFSCVLRIKSKMFHLKTWTEKQSMKNEICFKKAYRGNKKWQNSPCTYLISFLSVI